jgi:signal transduction histidine kinase
MGSIKAQAMVNPSLNNMENTQAYLQAAIELSALPVFAIDTDWCYTFFNQAYLDMMKQSYGVLTIHEGDPYISTVLSEADRQQTTELFSRAMAGEDFKITSSYGDPHLHNAPYEIICHPIKDSVGCIIGITTLFQDITERLRIQKQLEDQRKKIEEQTQFLCEIDQFKNKVLSVVAHDLRSPISNLILSMQLIDVNRLSLNEIQNTITNISNSASTIKKTLDDLLHWSLMESRFEHPQPEAITMLPFINDHIGMYTTLAQQKGITITAKCSALTIVLADRRQLSLLFRNFIDNAIKFTPANGRIELGITEENKWLHIYCANTGKGIDDEVIDKILLSEDAYTSEGTSGEKGTGLGLQLCKEFIKNMNSRLEIENKDNGWTVFSFKLPK